MKLPVAFPSLLSDDLKNLRQFLSSMLTRIAVAFNNPDHGATGARPTLDLTDGQFFFDDTLGKPIWWRVADTHWVDATGTHV